MAPKITATGLMASEKFVTVSISIEQGGSLRFGVVQIPFAWLLSHDVTDGMDRTHRRALIEAWSEVDLCDPLF